MRRTAILILTIIAVYIQAFAYSLEYLYHDETNTCTITGVFYKQGETANVKIPETTISPKNATKVYRVTAIGQNAFAFWAGLNSVSIPSTVVSIDNVAFQGCKNLSSVKIPNSVTHIGDGAFRDCVALTTIHIPNSVTEIGMNPFIGCPYIRIEVDNDNPNFIVERSVLYTKDGQKLISYLPGLKRSHFEIPDSVSVVGAYSFYDCDNLTEIILHSGLKSIEDGAFKDCNNLTEIEIPNSVINIGAGVFGMCTSLVKAKLPDCLKTIQAGLFGQCSSLSNIAIPQTVDSIGLNAFAYCTNLCSVQLPEKLRYLGETAFMGCSNLTSIRLNIDKIERSSFRYCTNLSEVSFGPNVKVIGNDAFEGCSYLMTINIPDSVISINNCAFEGCKALSDVVLGSSVEYIGPGAFYGCTNLKNLTIKDGTKELELANYTYNVGSSSRKVGCFFNCPIEQLYLGRNLKYPFQGQDGISPFYENKSLKRVIVGDSVSIIGPRLFECCSSLNYIKLGKFLTEIGGSAFEGCENLSNVEVYSIDNFFKLNKNSHYLLYYASNLYVDNKEVDEITVPDWVSEISEYLFQGWKGIRRINVGNSVKKIGQHAFAGCSGLESIVIGANVDNIGSGALSNCNSLKSFVIEDGNTFVNMGANLFINTPIQYVYMGRPIIYDTGAYSDYSVGPFYKKTTLTELEIGDSVTSLSGNLFQGCKNLKNVKLGSSLSHIGYSTFKDCETLEGIIIPSSVKEINDYAFDGCSGLLNVTFPSIESLCKIKFGGKDANPLSLAHHLFINGEEITDVKIPETVASIGDYAFCGMSSLYSLEISASVSSIGRSAFKGCDGLKNVTFSSIEDICRIKFENEYSNPLNLAQHLIIEGEEIIDVKIPETVASIGDYAFCGMSSLYSLELPNSVISIGSSAFCKCVGLTSLNIPTSVTTIDQYAFDGCIGLQILEMPASIKSVGWYAFYNCGNLTDIYYNTSEPISTSKSVFDNSTYRNATLHITENGIELAKSTSPWMYFENIKGDMSSVDKVEIDTDFKASIDVYNLQGKKISNSTDNLSPGLYIIHQGGITKKVIIE